MPRAAKLRTRAVPINVALHEMAADAPGGGEGSLEINRAIGAEAAQIGARDRLLEQIKSEVAITNGRYR